MPDPHAEAEAKLRQLAHRLRLGAAQLYPATEKQLDMVRQIARQQWAQEQKQLAQSPPAQKRTQQQTPAQSHAKAQQKQVARPTRRQQPIKQIPPPTQRHSH